MVKTTIPSPPIHCVTLRQKSSPWGSESICVMQVAPVVENPLIVSKKASVRLMWATSMKGMRPSTENITHESETTRKLSVRVMRCWRLLRPAHLHTPPMRKHRTAVRRKACASPSP